MTLYCLGISFMLWLSPESSCTGPCGKTCETVKWSHADINVEKLVKQWNEAIQTLTFPQKVGILVHVGKTGQTVKWSHADINISPESNVLVWMGKKLVKQWNEAIQTSTFLKKVEVLVHVGKTGQTVKWNHADINISPESRSTGPRGKKLVSQWNEAMQTLTFSKKVEVLVHVGKTGLTVKWSHADINISPESRSTGPYGKNWSNSGMKPCRH